jgi:hypothetical protein
VPDPPLARQDRLGALNANSGFIFPQQPVHEKVALAVCRFGSDAPAVGRSKTPVTWRQLQIRSNHAFRSALFASRANTRLNGEIFHCEARGILAALRRFEERSPLWFSCPSRGRVPAEAPTVSFELLIAHDFQFLKDYWLVSYCGRACEKPEEYIKEKLAFFRVQRPIASDRFSLTAQMTSNTHVLLALR